LHPFRVKVAAVAAEALEKDWCQLQLELEERVEVRQHNPSSVVEAAEAGSELGDYLRGQQEQPVMLASGLKLVLRIV